jgi:HK97 family phage portal protein
VVAVGCGAAAAGVPITNDSALELSVVWACVMAIVDAIAPSPWNIYDQKHDARLEIVPYDDPMMYLLNTRPNADMTAIGLKETLLIGALTWGNGYAEIQRDNSQRIAALWPLLPHRTFPRAMPTTCSITSTSRWTARA